jgi:hypothetical protein
MGPGILGWWSEDRRYVESGRASCSRIARADGREIEWWMFIRAF